MFQDSLPEATARKLLNEYLLDDILPADAEQINQLFQAQLAQRHISGMAGVFYIHTQARTQTRAGILPTASAYRTPVYQLDLTHNLQLQGWADYDLLTLLRYVPVAYYGTFSWCCSPEAYCFTYAIKNGRKSLQKASTST